MLLPRVYSQPSRCLVRPVRPRDGSRPDRGRDRDLQVPPVRHRRHHRQDPGLRGSGRLHHGRLHGRRRGRRRLHRRHGGACRSWRPRSSPWHSSRRDCVFRRIARRIVYGDLATPYETLSTFAERLSQTFSIDDVLPSMAKILAEGTGASRAEVWLRVGCGASAICVLGRRPMDRGLHRCHSTMATMRRSSWRAAWKRRVAKPTSATKDSSWAPSSSPSRPTSGSRLRRRSCSRISPRRPAWSLSNVALIADLRASRQRLVSAQDQERRKIERNLHDGAQQQLVALAVKMRLIEGMARERPPQGRRARARSGDGDE